LWVSEIKALRQSGAARQADRTRHDPPMPTHPGKRRTLDTLKRNCTSLMPASSVTNLKAR